MSEQPEEILPLHGKMKRKPGRPKRKPEMPMQQPRPRGRPPLNAPKVKPVSSKAYVRPDTIVLKYSDGREARTTNLDVDAWLPVFIKHLSLWGNVTAAAEYVGISRKTARKAYNERPDVREQWHEAIDEAAERLEMDVAERARKSDLLAMFLLKGLKPEKYREKYEAPANQQATDFIVEIGNEPVHRFADQQPSAFIEADRIDSATTRIFPE
jgi:hypothetical protein